MQLFDVTLSDPRHNNQSFRPRYRTYETDIDRNSVAHSRVLGNNLIFTQGSRNKQDRINREQKRLYGSVNREQNEDLDEIKNDVALLEEELALRRRDNSIKTFKLRRKSGNRSKVYTYSVPNQERPSQERQGQIRKLRYNHPQPEYYRIKTSPRKKIYRVKPKIHKYTQYQEEESKISMPLIKISRRYHTEDQTHRSHAAVFPRMKIRHPLSRLLRTSHNLKRVRKIVNVILFTIKLKSFNDRMRKKRIKIFQRFVEESLNQKLLELKQILIQYSKPFFMTLIDQHNFSFRLQDKDEPKLNRQKVASTLKLIGMEVRCLQKCVRHMVENNLFVQTLYLLCKHGNYSCIEEINTNQEMNLICISEVFGYSRSDKYMEQSSILSLVFIKILLFNILLQPDRIGIQVASSVNPSIIYSNLRLIGNILYELFIDVQDQYLEKAPILYKIGNWLQLKKRFNFKISQSMTLKEGFYQKNELISGLASHNYIQSIYKLKQLTEERHVLTELVRLLHQSIVAFHLQFRKQTFVM